MHLGNYAIESWFSVRFAQAIVAVVFVVVDDEHGLSRSICLKHFAHLQCENAWVTLRHCTFGSMLALYTHMYGY